MAIPNAHDKVVSLVRLKGPVLPSQINKEIETDILFASAILSELVYKKTLKISSLKVGGSPLYYAPGQEYKLQQYSDKLHPKEKEAYEILKQKKILKDDKQQPAIRAALRQIKDFAKPLQVTSNGVNHIFWKWYLLPNEEAGKTIRSLMKIPEIKKQEPIKPQPVQKKIEPEVKKKTAEKTEEKKPVPKREIKKKEVQKELKKEPEIKIDEPKDKFFRKLKKYFDESSITVLDFKVVRKESDIEFTVKIPSTVGTLTYFCKAKNKKKVSDGDLSAVYINAQSKKMPVLFLTTGELTKKAKGLLEKEFRNLSVKKI